MRCIDFNAAFATAPYSRFISLCRRNYIRPLCVCANHQAPADANRGSSLPGLRVLDINGPAVGYREAWRWQHAVSSELRKDQLAPDTLILLEHPPVYTLGSRSDLENVLFPGNALSCDESQGGEGRAQNEAPELVRTERGGEVTYHGPGQLVVYPILNLSRHRKDLHWYMRQLEETVIDLLKREYDVSADRKDGLTGVWVGDGKVAAIGLKVSKWVTMHGVAINVDLDLEPFDKIVPCGIDAEGLHVTKVAHVANPKQNTSMQYVRSAYVEAFCRVFGPYQSSVVVNDAAKTLLERLMLRAEAPLVRRG